MYRFLVYGLVSLIVIATIMALTGIVHFSAIGILVSTAVLIVVCYASNRLIAILANAQANTESWLITALILALILPPASTILGAGLVALGGLIAMVSKYVLVLNHRHIFNPAAFAAVVLSISGILPALWWVGSPPLIIPTVIFGALVLRKLHRFGLFGAFFGSAVALTTILALVTQSQPVMAALTSLVISGPLLFLGTIMLTEPATLPNGRWAKLVFGGLVGLIFCSQLHVGPVAATPELALIIGNLFALVVSYKYGTRQVRLLEKKEIGTHLYEFTFSGGENFYFLPGQYGEWTMPRRGFDSRGDRRSFSISSEPGAKQLSFATKIIDGGSVFKTHLSNMKKGDVITVGHANGDFVMPHALDQKLVYVAGGIGITPFVSMVRSMIASKNTRDIIIFYLVTTEAEYAYKDVWAQAEQYGVKVIPVVTGQPVAASWHGLSGPLTPEVIKHYVPDYSDRHFYLSGPNGLVQAYRNMLKGLSVAPGDIRSDYFSGY
jgi:ferredoxin-NADP reductase/Na+-translocating ferredoxin:NAD+ oxidoreductase RnfD subunit